MRRVSIGILFGSLVALPVLAQSEDTIQNDLQRCAGLESPEARLACFEDLANVEKRRSNDEFAKPRGPGAEPVPAREKTPDQEKEELGAERLKTPKQQREELGAERVKDRDIDREELKAEKARRAEEKRLRKEEKRLRKAEEKAAKKAAKAGITFTVIRTSKDREGRFTFYMSDGQVWREIEPSYARVPREGSFDVNIARGGFGDYKLRIGGKGRLTRVVRLQ